MSRKSTIIYGIATNDAQYVTQRFGKVICPYYGTWKRMLDRCYFSGGAFPTYKDKEVCKEWLTFSNFKSWMEKQDWEGKDLDKDLINGSTREYSPTSCCFVDKRINLLLGVSDGKRGDTLLGVTRHRTVKGDKFKARCAGRYLGLFSTQKPAHDLWKCAKAFDIEQAVLLFKVPDAVRYNLLEVASFLRSYNGVVNNLYDLLSKEKRQSLLVNL